MISSNEISVVVQGAISDKYTKNALLNIRKVLPNAEIILSTWENSNTNGLCYDVLVENVDPGAPMLYPKWNQTHNLNRQIISTKNGIKKATRKYVLKTRTDILHNNANFLDYFGKFQKRNENCKILKERVLICQHFARRAEVLPFHISDWVFFGLKEDVENIWDVEIEPEPEYTEWFYNHELLPQHKDQQHPFNFFRHRYCAEQYIWANFLWRNGQKFTFNQMFDISWDNSNLTKLSFANNLVILSLEQYGIAFCKKTPMVEDTIYTNYDWKKLYKSYCDENFIIEDEPIDYDEIFGIKKYKHRIKKIKSKFSKRNIICNFVHILKILILCLMIVYNVAKKSYKIILRKTSIFSFLDKYIATLPDKAEQINIIEASLGESLIFAKIMDYLISNNAKYNNFAHLFIKSKQDIFKLYSDLNINYLKKEHIYLKDNTYYYKNKKIKFYFGREFWFSLFGSKEHFLDVFQKELGIDFSKIDMKLNPKISENAKISALNKVKNIKLNLENFIFISPEASSMDELPKGFWSAIVNKYTSQGYDVFNNITNLKNNINNTKTCDLTIEEAYVIASHAKKIIGLRSGFLELFLSLDVPLNVIYNIGINYKNRHITNMIDNYTLFKYPKNPNLIINEYEYKKYQDNSHLIDCI